MSRTLGQNMKKLIAHKMSHDAIPDGGGFEDGIRFLTTPGALSTGWRKAVEWCDMAILVVRNAAEPNPWKNASEEEIAAELLARIENWPGAHPRENGESHEFEQAATRRLAYEVWR